MIIYNVTINVEKDISAQWLTWMKDVHIPQVMQTGMFESHRLLKLLNEEENNTGITYAIQYACKDIHRLSQYLQDHAPALRKDHTERFKDKFVAFRTILEDA